MKVAIIYNKDFDGVINKFGMQNREIYSEDSVKRVYNALESGGHNVNIIDGNMYVAEKLQEFMPKVLEEEKMGMVFNMAYGIQGESRYTHIPALLEMLGIPYVGSNPSGHALALDKVFTKIVLQKYSIPTPDFWVLNSCKDELKGIEFPCIVKPKMESVSFGLKIVYDEEELREAVKFVIDEFKQQALVEKFIRGREFCVGLLGNGDDLQALPVLEIDLENDPNGIQSFEDKKYAPKNKICPAEISEELARYMVAISKDAFNVLQLKDFARVDIRMDEDGNIYILEINSMASLGSTGSYVHAANVAGYNFDKLVNKMLEVASKRYFEEGRESEIEEKPQDTSVKIRTYLNKNKEYFENVLKEAVNLNTHVRNLEGVNNFSELIIKKLTPLGFKLTQIPMVEIGNFSFLSNCQGEEYDVVFINHLDDNVKLPKHKVFERNENKLYGTSIWSYKGGIVSQIAALKALNNIKSLKKIKVGILLTSDNSIQGKFSKEVIQSVSRKAKLVIGATGSNSKGGIITTRAGSAIYECYMNLLNQNEAFDSSEAVNLLSKCICKWAEMSKKEEGLIVLPEDINIQSKILKPYSNGYVRLNVKFSRNENIKDMDKMIKKVIPNKIKDKFQIYIKGGVTRPAMQQSQVSIEFIERLKKIANKLDVRLKEEHVWESSNLCQVSDEIITVDGIGPVGKRVDNNLEYIYSHSITEKATLIALILHEMKK